MKIAVYPRYVTWCFLVIAGILTFLGHVTVHEHQCASTPGAKIYPTSRKTSNGSAVKLDNNYESFWLQNLRNLSSASAVISSSNKYLFFSSELLTQNISKYEQEWFRNISDEHYLAANLSVFKRSATIKNRLHYNYLIKGDNICKGGQPFLLVLIPSVANNSAERDAIRWTWLRAAETNSWPRVFIRDQIKHIFLFGRQESRNNEDYKQLLHESNIVGDIVMADFEDTYRNLIRKMVIGLSWVRQYCSQAQFVLKADPDTFINVPLMMEIIHKAAANLKRDSFVMGFQHNSDKPIVVRRGKWEISKEFYPLDFYPRYFYGPAYVLSRKAVIDITETAPYVNFIGCEDAFITGIVPKVAGISRITARSFAVCCRKIFDCDVVWNKNVALTEIKRPNLLLQLWANIITGQCNDRIPFI